MSRINVFVTIPTDGRILTNIISRHAPKPGQIVEPVEPGQDRPYRFVAYDGIGVNRVDMARYSLPSDVLGAWLTLTDPDARRAALDHFVGIGAASVKTDKTGEVSSISNLQPPTEDDLATVCDLLPDGWSTLDALNGEGYMLVPTDAAERAASTAKGSQKLSEAERRAAVAADFAARKAQRDAAVALVDARIMAVLDAADAGDVQTVMDAVADGTIPIDAPVIAEVTATRAITDAAVTAGLATVETAPPVSGTIATALDRAVAAPVIAETPATTARSKRGR